jgi:hypothetical protein
MVRFGIGGVLTGILAALAFAAPPAVSPSSAQVKPAYRQLIERYPAPKLAAVDAREFKVLIDPAQTKVTVDEAFRDLWTRIRAAAAKQGLTVIEKAKDPLAIEFSTKEYFDTVDQALWSRGYLIRITTSYKDGKPNPQVEVTVKTIFDDAEKTLAAPLAVVGIEKFKTEAEDNVGFVPGGALRGYVEKGSSFSVPLSALGRRSLSDFGKFVPELLKLGLPAETPLIGNKAYSYRVRPGAVVLPGTEPCGVSMEAWSATEGGAPYVYDFAFGYNDIDFYALETTHAAGEQFMLKVFKGELPGLGGADGDRWGGSKVRKLMNRPIVPAAGGAPAPQVRHEDRQPFKSWAAA